MEARVGLVPASVFKTDDALREQRHGGFDSHALPPLTIVNNSETSRRGCRNYNGAVRIALLATLALSSVAHADPASIARALVVNQLAAAHSPQAFIATLAPNAVILGNGSFAVANSSNAPEVVSTMLRRRLITQTFVNQVDAGGSGNALWFSADVIFIDDNGCGGTDARLVELAVADHDRWNIVAVSFTSSSGLTAPGDILDRPHAGPLTKDLASFTTIEDELRDDSSTMVAVHGKDRRDVFGLGRDDARRALEPLRAQDVSVTNAIEVHGPHWGFAFGSLAIAGESAQVLLVAIPDGQTWSAVAVQVTELDPDAPPPPCRAPPITSTALERKTITP